MASVGKIQDLADPKSKMSKSLSSPNGIIELLDDPKINARKIKSAVTDSGREITFDEVGKPGVANLLTILAALTDTDTDVLVAEVRRSRLRRPEGRRRRGGDRGGHPVPERTLELLGERSELEAILARGAERAREVAGPTLADVYAKVGPWSSA